MLSQKNIVVTIGNYGAVVAFHNGNILDNKIFLDELNDSSKEELRTLFSKNSSAPIYVLVDTIDQSYKKKVYPPIRKGDLIRIIKRDMAVDGDKESLKNYILYSPKRSKKGQPGGNKRECLFVSSSNSESINQWLEFLLEAPNRLVGIYMLPIEVFSLFQLLKSDIKSKTKAQGKKNELYCIIMHNKVSGIRQVVFSTEGIVFTRVVNYNFSQPDFLEKYGQDLYSTFEYLKRLFPDLTANELDVINIFPSEILEQIKNTDDKGFSIINYTPFEAASKAGFPKILSENANFCDLLISKSFSRSKKVLKFILPKIVSLEKFFIFLRLSYYLNLVLVVGICSMIVFSIFAQKDVGALLEKAESEKFNALEEFAKIKKSTLEIGHGDGSDDIDAERITDFGKLEEAVGTIGEDISDFYIKLKFLKSFDVILSSFGYNLNGFDSKNPNPGIDYKFSLNGDILNKSGDIEDLFREFDALTAEVKKSLDKNQIKYTELPKNIDFNQKYYSFPIDFSISKGK